jgi:hypothetical protein
MNLATPPRQTITPSAANPIATGRCLTGRGARGSDSGIGGGGGAWKFSSEALINSISYVSG